MFYNAKLKVSIEDDKGRIRKQTWVYLVDAVSITDAEAIVTERMKDSMFDWEVKSVSETNFIEVLSAGAGQSN